jgi:hypothetical protein
MTILKTAALLITAVVSARFPKTHWRLIRGKFSFTTRRLQPPPNSLLVKRYGWAIFGTYPVPSGWFRAKWN